MPKILVVEDEVDVNNLIRTQFEREGYEVAQAFDGPSALKQVERHQPDLIVLDWMLPGMDGLSVCREIRRTHLMPIIMLTARGEEIDRVVGLEVGADDYVVKPFGVRELLARVRAHLRRVALDTPAPGAVGAPTGEVLGSGAIRPTSTSAGGLSEGMVVHGPLRIDLTGRTVHIHGTDDPAPADGAEWLLTFTADGVEVQATHAKGDVALRGPAHELLLTLWRRRPLVGLDVVGDAAVAERLLEVARF